MEDGNRMPIYVYERPDGSRFELRQGFNDTPLATDPETGVPVRRVLQPAPVIFKGSGWYKTDSRAAAPAAASNGATESKAPDAAPAAEKSESGTTSEAAPAAKAESAAVPTKPSAEAKKAADKIAAQAAS